MYIPNSIVFGRVTKFKQINVLQGQLICLRYTITKLMTNSGAARGYCNLHCFIFFI